MLRFPEDEDGLGAMEAFCLPLSQPRKSSLVSMSLAPSGPKPVQSTPAKRSIGNVTISTIRRAPDGLRTPLQRLVGSGPLSSPIKALRPIDEDADTVIGMMDNKENVCPRAPSKYQFGQTLYSSPAFHGPPPAPLQPTRRPTVDWEALENLVRSSGPGGSQTPAAPPSLAPLQSEADEIESLLFSTDAPLAQDIFLGYDDPGSDTESMFAMSTVSSRRPRSTSILSIQQRPETPGVKAARGRIQVRIRSTRKELPALKSGSQLRKMVLAGEPPTPGRPSSEVDDPIEYSKFISKLQADEPVDSEPEDDEFKEAENDDEEDEEEEEGEMVIQRHEIEGLFEDTQNPAGKLSKTNLTISAPSYLYPPDEPAPSPAVMLSTIKDQIQQHYILCVQLLGLCGEINGAAENIPVLVRMLVSLQSVLPSEMKPLGLDQGLASLKASFPDPMLRESWFGPSSRSDPMLRFKSTIKTISPVHFKHGNIHDPYALSPAYDGMLQLFNVQPTPALAFYYAASTYIDNNNQAIQSTPGGVLPRGRRNDSFLKCEDALLLMGLKKFGLANWEMIQAQFLPTRTTRQIMVRFKNLSARRAPANPIKDFVNTLWRPLSKAEEDLIYRGVQRFGRDFKKISSHYLPHRPPTILRNLFEQLNDIRRQSQGERNRVD